MPRDFLNLRIRGALEDIPSVLSASGKLGGKDVDYLQRRDGPGILCVIEAKQARLWTTQGAKAPGALGSPMTIKDAADAYKAVQGNPDKGPETLKGRWAGKLTTDHTVVLVRKVASYGELEVTSQNGRWVACFRRDARWFGSAATKVTAPQDTLSDAVIAGMGVMYGLTGEACAVRDTSRRAAKDADYAATLPPKPVKPEKPVRPAKVETVAERPAKASGAKADKPKEDVLSAARRKVEGARAAVEAGAKHAKMLLGGARKAVEALPAGDQAPLLREVNRLQAVVGSSPAKPATKPAESKPKPLPGIPMFMAVYAEELRDAVRKQPDRYKYGVEGIPKVLDKMREALGDATFSKDGAAFEATTKRLGIKNTSAAINGFLANPPKPADGPREVKAPKAPAGASTPKAPAKPAKRGGFDPGMLMEGLRDLEREFA